MTASPSTPFLIGNEVAIQPVILSDFLPRGGSQISCNNIAVLNHAGNLIRDSKQEWPGDVSQSFCRVPRRFRDSDNWLKLDVFPGRLLSLVMRNQILYNTVRFYRLPIHNDMIMQESSFTPTFKTVFRGERVVIIRGKCKNLIENTLFQL